MMRRALASVRVVGTGRRPVRGRAGRASLPILVKVIFLLLLEFVAGCGKREAAASHTAKADVLHVAIKAEPRDLDPHLATSQEEFFLVGALIEGLTALDPAARPIAGAAEKWETSPDGRTWTFHLRANARWSNGDPVTARDFVFGFQRTLTPELGAEFAPQLYCLRGAEDYHHGKTKSFDEVGARATDDHTLALTLLHPVPYLPALTALPAWFPAHRPTIEKFDGLRRRGSPWTRPENFVGNGAFLLKVWRPNQVLELARAPTYWGRENVGLESAVINPVENVNTQEAMFRAGQLDITSDSIPVEKVRAYRQDPTRAAFLREGTLLATKFFRFNCTRTPLTDIRVRRALALAIDRPKLTRNVMQNEFAAFCFTPPDCGGYTANHEVSTDVDAARRLLAEAGFAGGKGFPRLELLFYPSGTSGQPVAEAIQQMWRATLGIDVAIVQQETKTVLDARRAQAYDILLSEWFGDYVDPLTFLDLWTRASEHNKTGWASAEYDGLLAQAADTLDPAARFDLLRRAESMVLREAPITPLFYLPSYELRRPRVKGWQTNPLSQHPLKFVSVGD